jgi:hypothetical protein
MMRTRTIATGAGITGSADCPQAFMQSSSHTGTRKVLTDGTPTSAAQRQGTRGPAPLHATRLRLSNELSRSPLPLSEPFRDQHTCKRRRKRNQKTKKNLACCFSEPRDVPTLALLTSL